jgi:aminobenzoyl-glutamate utilization protein B
MRTKEWSLLVLAVLLVPDAVAAQADKERMVASIEAAGGRYAEVAREIWGLAEVGYQEERSSALLQATLEDVGFTVETGVAGMPTAFVARYGSGNPVIGIMAEFDALPGITQDSVPFRKPLVTLGAGHACGHHLFGTGSVAAAIAVREWLERSGAAGEIRLYGTPAEEGGAGKVYMVREGLFDDVDIVLHWHAGDRNDASPGQSLANRSAKFRFHGVSAHAAGAPHRGRSALDGVEAMNIMVNMLREHVPQETRIHYVITGGGFAPNVIPDFAEVFYYVRHPNAAVLEGIWERVLNTAEGAAVGTGTRVEHEVIHGIHSLLPNDALGRVMDVNLQRVGGVRYSDTERAFAEKIHATLGEAGRPLEGAAQVAGYGIKPPGGSTDVGDVSWVVPTAGLRTATWVPGTSAHTWQAIAAGGTTIGTKGMLVAAKTLALTAYDLFTDSSIIDRARAEFEQRRGPDFVYRSLLGDRAPPLDYRR